MPRLRAVRRAAALLIAAACLNGRVPSARSGLADLTDLDAFMQKVLARRDDNWRKLQQYVLEERERIELRGPGRAPIWGDEREYSWFIRDGYFVRSPVKVNGATISEADRLKYEAEYLRRAKARDARGGSAPAEKPPADVQTFIQQTRQPQFISSAYFLRFRFEEGTYALFGHEPADGRDLLRIEYYPSKLLFSRNQRRAESDRGNADKARIAEMERMLNKVSLITLWVDPASSQIVKYTFQNIDADFLPAAWLVRVGDLRASMTMGQPFEDVWLPRDLDLSVSLTLAGGQFDLHYGVDYHDYRQADVKAKVHVGDGR